MSQYNIMTILVSHRTDSAKDVQRILTEFGCNIKVRIGLHETSQQCAEDGLIVLQLDGDEDRIDELKVELDKLSGVQNKLITFTSE